MLSCFPPTGKIIQCVSLRSQVLVSLPVKLVLYGKNCHVPCAIEGAVICPSDLSWHAGNFFRVAHDAALPATFCPAVSGWLPADRFKGESRMSCRVDETCSRMERTLENHRSLRQHASRPVLCATNNASALGTLGVYLYQRRRNCMQLNGPIFSRLIDTSISAIHNNDSIITSIWQLEEWWVDSRQNYSRLRGHVSCRRNWHGRRYIFIMI